MHAYLIRPFVVRRKTRAGLTSARHVELAKFSEHRCVTVEEGTISVRAIVGSIKLRDFKNSSVILFHAHCFRLLLYCCQLTSTQILGCEFKEESEMFGADVGLFVEMNKRNQLNGPSVIRDVFSKKRQG